MMIVPGIMMPVTQVSISKHTLTSKHIIAMNKILNFLKNEFLGTPEYRMYSAMDKFARRIEKYKKKKMYEPLYNILLDTKKDEFLREMAADALGDIRDKNAVEALVLSLKIEYEKIEIWPSGILVDVLKASILALGKIGGTRGSEPLCKILLDIKKDEYLRELAANALGDILDKNAVEALVLSLKIEYEKIEIWPDGYTLVDVLKASILALGKIGDTRGSEPLCKILLDIKKDGYIRELAANALGDIRDKNAIETLVLSLETEKEEDVLIASSKALAKIGDSRGVDYILHTLDGYYYARHKGVGALEEIGWKPTTEEEKELYNSAKNSKMCYQCEKIFVGDGIRSAVNLTGDWGYFCSNACDHKFEREMEQWYDGK